MDFEKILAGSFWASLFDWIALKIAPLIAGFAVGFNVGRKEVIQKENEITRLKLKLGEKENAEIVEKDSAGKSDADLVRASINDGRRNP